MSAAQGEDRALGGGRLGRILVVGDQTQSGDMLGRRLERRGYEVLRRESAAGVEDAIAENRIELVLLEWIMPEGPGAEALAAIRAYYDAEHLPVIVVSAVEDALVESLALEAGASDFLTKPIDLRVLSARIKTQLDRRRAVLNIDVARAVERAVEARTLDLITANRSLSAEISEREAAEARAQSLARHDPLTGLANRRHFLEEMDRRLALVADESSAFALMFVDLDRFKPINDVHGHAIGDELLHVIATRLTSCIRSDSFAARLGGDEFAILLEGPVSSESAGVVARRVLSELGAPIHINGLKLSVGASVGIALCPEDGRSSAALLQHGDAAMRRAKEDRGVFKFFDSSIDEELRAKAALESELRAAIPNGDITPYFQPLVNLADGSLASFEVLARWPHRDRGMISPGEFIPVAEEAGLVDAMFWSLFAQACRAANAALGNFSLAVNISPSQVRDQWFPEKVMRVLQETGFPAHRLEIEVTESAMIGDVARAKAALLSLKNQGVRIALDDFGTGYSSLLLLRELPIDILKIDQSFVSRMTTDRESATIVGALIGLGRALGLEVTAEGVEDRMTADALRALGCERAQGYLFGSAEAFCGVALREAV